MKSWKIRSLLKGELIGLEVRVIDSSHPGYVGIHGKVVDETKNTLKIETEEGEKVVPKGVCVFAFKVGDKWIEVNGAEIAYRPHERILKSRWI